MSPDVCKYKIVLIEQSVWRSESNSYLSMPLASGYLKAVVLSDAELRSTCDIEILNFAGNESVSRIVQAVLGGTTPHLVAFSVLGWNYFTFGQVATTLKQIAPSCWIVWGGNHASLQAARTAAVWPAVDITVNGEGEITFREVVRALVEGLSIHDLEGVDGLSFRMRDGSLRTMAPRERLAVLDDIPSPILSGAIPLADETGQFPYDYALMETNRGCPYTCAFCYWGGAIGQKVRTFSLDRLQSEVEILAKHRVAGLMLCDANFGMLREDEAFLEICIKSRERYGFPKTIMTSWAKNKGKIFFRMVRRMREAGFHSAFNLALQSMNEPVLQAMGRKNMKINDWEQLAQWLRSEGFDLYGELIWGCPGETVDSFLQGYDELARYVTRIAVYPLLLMPNTAYSEEREKHGFVTWRSNEHDFELVLCHATMPIRENRRMHAFLFWARVIAEHLLFRHVWDALRVFCGITQSQLLMALDEWLTVAADPLARQLTNLRNQAVDRLEVTSRDIEAALQLVYCDVDAETLFRRWWREAMTSRIEVPYRAVLADIFDYDLVTLPIYRGVSRAGSLSEVVLDDQIFLLRSKIQFQYDVVDICAALAKQRTPGIAPNFLEGDVSYKKGFCNDMRLYHNAHNLGYFGRFTRGGIDEPASIVSAPLVSRPGDAHVTSTGPVS